MVVETWMHKKKKKKKSKNGVEAAEDGGGGAATMGILSFEAASAMSRAVQLHRSLSDPEASRLRSETLSSHAVRTLVSSSEGFLIALALAEKLDSLNRVAAAASRLGRRSPSRSHPALLGFEHVYADLLASSYSPLQNSHPLAFPPRAMEAAVRKMERLANSTSALYTELEALEALEQSARKLPNPDARRPLDQKIRWQRGDVRQLRDASLWNRTFDEAALLLARAVCTIHARIRVVFADAFLDLSTLESSQSRLLSGTLTTSSRVLPPSGQIHLEKRSRQMPIKQAEPPGFRFPFSNSPGRVFMECLSWSSSAALANELDDVTLESESCVSRPMTGPLVPFSGVPFSTEHSKSGIGKNGRSWFGLKSSVVSLATPATVGGSALALHYANIIIIVEKLLQYPHLVGEEARDDLYQMLPSSLRIALRKSLRSYVKNLAIYDAPLAHDWKEALDKILSWLAPMAHNMIRWQTDRNFEQQQIVLRSNVLLLETLYFADREKTEVAICELLVGLNYICRYEQQQNALLDCTSSLDFDDCMDWQLKY